MVDDRTLSSYEGMASSPFWYCDLDIFDLEPYISQFPISFSEREVDQEDWHLCKT